MQFAFWRAWCLQYLVEDRLLGSYQRYIHAFVVILHLTYPFFSLKFSVAPFFFSISYGLYLFYFSYFNVTSYYFHSFIPKKQINYSQLSLVFPFFSFNSGWSLNVDPNLHIFNSRILIRMISKKISKDTLFNTQQNDIQTVYEITYYLNCDSNLIIRWKIHDQ